MVHTRPAKYGVVGWLGVPTSNFGLRQPIKSRDMLYALGAVRGTKTNVYGGLDGPPWPGGFVRPKATMANIARPPHHPFFFQH